MANDDVITQAQLKLEMMSNEQIGPIQMAMMLKECCVALPPQYQTPVVVAMGMRSMTEM